MKNNIYIFINITPCGLCRRVFTMLIALVSCREKMNINYNIVKDMENINYEAIESLKSKKIFFGHASVGYNIINGIKDIKVRNISLLQKNTLMTVGI